MTLPSSARTFSAVTVAMPWLTNSAIVLASKPSPPRVARGPWSHSTPHHGTGVPYPCESRLRGRQNLFLKTRITFAPYPPVFASFLRPHKPLDSRRHRSGGGLMSGKLSKRK